MQVILLMAQTVDGKIARDSSHFTDWTGKEDKKLFMELTKDAGVVIMGSNTYRTMKMVLPDRYNIVMVSDVIKANYKNIHENEKGWTFTALEPKQVIRDLEILGYTKVILIGGSALNSSFARQGLIDEIHITIVPKIFGMGLSIFGGKFDLNLTHKSTETFSDGSVYLQYIVEKGN